MKDRIPGYYWMKIMGKWCPGELSEGGCWYTFACDISCREGDIDAIGPRIEPPAELEGK